jgi:hypothetical protein
VLPPERARIEQHKQDFQSVCDDLGFQVKDSKSEEGTTVSFLGIELDTVKMEGRLPKDKYQKATTLVAETLHHSSVKYSELESLVGFLAFASKVVRSSRPFLRELYRAAHHVHTISASRATSKKTSAGGTIFYHCGTASPCSRLPSLRKPDVFGLMHLAPKGSEAIFYTTYLFVAVDYFCCYLCGRRESG